MKKAEIKFPSFELEPRTDGNECYDSFHIYESYPNYDTLIATFCGMDLNGRNILTDISTIYIIFRSDALNEHMGFQANIKFHNSKMKR